MQFNPDSLENPYIKRRYIRPIGMVYKWIRYNGNIRLETMMSKVLKLNMHI